MESQLREQGAGERLDEVLEEIPRVRKDLGYIPLVTPTSQIVGTQAVMNVLQGERFKSISKETRGILRGEYGATPAPVDKALQAKVLNEGETVITCRPADLLKPEMARLTDELKSIALDQKIELAEGENVVDDVLTYALFNQIGRKFLVNRGNPDAFEPAPDANEAKVVTTSGGEEVYTVNVEGKGYTVTVTNGGDITAIVPRDSGPAPAISASVEGGVPVNAPLAGNIFKVFVGPGQEVDEGDTIVILEAMKMETEIKAPSAGTIGNVNVKQGDVVAVGDILITIV